MRTFRTTAGALVLLTVPAALGAQTPSPPPPIWSGEAALSYVQTSGNSQSRSLGAGFKLVYQSDPWKAELRSTFLQSSAEGVENSRRFQLVLRGERALGGRLALYAQGSHLRDLFAGIEGQEILEGGGLYKLLPGPRHVLSASAGLAYTREGRVSPGEDLSFLGGRAGLSYRCKIAPGSEFGEDVDYLYDFKDSRDWRANAVTSLTASVTKVLSVKLSHQLSYVRSPVPGKKRTDVTVLASLVAKF